MNINNVIALENYGETYIANMNETPDEKKIREAVKKFRVVVPNVTEEEVEEAIKNLETRYFITMDMGAIIRNKETYKKWYFNSLAERETNYWDRYKRYLQNDARMPAEVIDSMDNSAAEIMDSLADPQSEYAFNSKGLVIGAVQSGKTSNYIALMNKAADSGYKVIILLTGTIEKLRQQTQGRVDEGFIGSDSKVQMDNKENVTIGVGKYKKLSVSPFTTTARDFNIREALKIDNQTGPVVLVLKKNKSVLEKVEKWLRINNLNPLTGKCESPLLLIDDEADNASVNTASEDKDPTVINRTIRNIINLFSKSSYVGFTATPFANIFIDPQVDLDDSDDLFPSDFIYLLGQPSNYMGPNEIYHEDGRYNYMIRNNDDVEEVLPLNHKNGDVFTELPNSLKDAIMTFFLANAIRDIRGQQQKHRSMLVHISRFISVQNEVRDKIEEYTRILKIHIQNYINSDEANDKVIQRLKELYKIEFEKKRIDNDERQVTWNEISEQLHKSVVPIQVKVINSGNASKNLNYDENDEKGLRLIAVGGLSLARGLTLEGLMTSYFYRNTKMYDTLMQMGRWFGYRDGYDDLCRLWTSSESAEWYRHISIATEELRGEIKNMANQNRKPIEFGLKVRSAEDAPLIVTAKNKMRNTDQKTFKRSVSGQMVETPILFSKKEKLISNNCLAQDWLKEINKYYVNDDKNIHLKRHTFKNVPREYIVKLIEELDFPYLNDIDGISEIIKTDKSDIFESWDVVLASNSKNSNKYVAYGEFDINPLERSFDFFGTEEDFIRMSGSSKRMGSTTFAAGGLTEEQYREIEPKIIKQRELLERKKDGSLKAASEYMYFNSGIKRSPLLVIYPILLRDNEKSNLNSEKINRFVEENKELITGIAIGIPDIEGVETVTYEYTINMVMQRELLGIPIDYDEPDDEEDEGSVDSRAHYV